MDVAVADKTKPLGKGRFSLRSLLLWTAFVAVPLACFRQYYAMVTDTVDERTIPLLNASGAALAFLGLGLLSIVLVCILYRNDLETTLCIYDHSDGNCVARRYLGLSTSECFCGPA